MLRKCCFCVNLKTGGIIIAWFNIVCNVFAVLMLILLLCFVELALDAKLRGESNESTPPTKVEKETVITWIKIIASIGMVMNIIHGVTNVILLVGIQKSRPQLVRIWLIVTPILTVVPAIIFWFYVMVNDASTPISDLPGLIFGYGLFAYFYCVIYSLYKEIKIERGARGQVEFTEAYLRN